MRIYMRKERVVFVSCAGVAYTKFRIFRGGTFLALESSHSTAYYTSMQTQICSASSFYCIFRCINTMEMRHTVRSALTHFAEARISRSRVLSQKAINIPSVAPPTPCAVTSPTAGRKHPCLRIGGKNAYKPQCMLYLPRCINLQAPRVRCFCLIGSCHARLNSTC